MINMIDIDTRVLSVIDGKIDFTCEGTVIESPATDPEGFECDGWVSVRWDDDQFEIVEEAELIKVHPLGIY